MLSRKGMDASWGGCPSPILPDGRLVPLPIPEPRRSLDQRRATPGADQLGVAYADLRVPRVVGTGTQSADALLRSLGRDAVVHPAAAYRGERGTRVRVPLRRARAHLDPDLVREATEREAAAWRPAFGQVGGAQSHLAAQGVGPGDLLLFFGWFRATRREGRRLRWDGPDLHVLWGWLSIDEVVPLDRRTDLGWSHPHLDGRDLARYGTGNTLYLAADRCAIDPALPGAGTFPQLAPVLQLTADGATRSVWDLPAALHPSASGGPLTWHAPARWSAPDPMTGRTTLRSVARGQEFVMPASDGVLRWARTVLATARAARNSSFERDHASGSVACAAACPCASRS